MYLYSFTQKMPTGHFTRRRAENNFRRESSDKFKQAYYWLSYEMYKNGIHIQHQFNGGEFYIPPYRVDGVSHVSRTAYEYNGCNINI